ncbi:Nephrocystin-3 [Madurella mycetomatis]|uniref:Nephrocystin-3 n=1 Tax=Madurella mycetomatis TaxID=100816 RepID=A0A175WH34_9PEZI|nr:Nephrocystin-3 [Madurella mycetomatis]
METLAHAIENLRHAAEDLRRAAEVLHGHPEDEDAKESYKRALGALNDSLGKLDTQFQHEGATEEDINAAIALVRKVQEIVVEGPVRLNILYVLCKLLIARYRRNRELEDLESAVLAAEEATNTAPVDGQDNPEYRIQLVASLGMLYMHTHSIDALQRAISEVEILLKALSPTDPRRADQVNNLGRLLGMRYEQTGLGVLADLDRAVSLLLGSVTKLSEGDRARIVGLDLLGNLLGMRYEQQGAMKDLDDAIEWSRKALKEAPADHPDRPGMLNNLANRLCRRAQRTRREEDINEAIRLENECRRTARPGHPDQGIWLGNLGTFHGIRLQLMKNPTRGDFDLAIGYAREAIKRTETGDPGHWSAAHTLANLLLSRYRNGQGSSTVGDLDEAIDVLRGNLGYMTADSPDRAFLLFSLGEALSWRYLRAKPDRGEDSIQAREAFSQSWAYRNAPVAVRIDAARRAAQLWADVSSWNETALYMERAVDLLHALSPRHLWNTDKQAMIRKFSGLAAAAAAAALNAGKEPSHALQYLELGRGIISGLLLDLRTDLSRLRTKYPDLADKFESLRSKLNSDAVPGSLHTPDGGAGSRREAADQFESLLEEIRAKEGFNEFLLPHPWPS